MARAGVTMELTAEPVLGHDRTGRDVPKLPVRLTGPEFPDRPPVRQAPAPQPTFRRIEMSTVTYVEPDGERHTLDVPVGTSLMAAGQSAGIHGIVAECGGCLSCATCHVYVEASSRPFADPSEDEEEMLEWTASPREASSRLSCQLVIENGADAVTVRVPDNQV
jgi:2Fe-2S ferredoxin